LSVLREQNQILKSRISVDVPIQKLEGETQSEAVSNAALAPVRATEERSQAAPHKSVRISDGQKVLAIVVAIVLIGGVGLTIVVNMTPSRNWRTAPTLDATTLNNRGLANVSPSGNARVVPAPSQGKESCEAEWDSRSAARTLPDYLFHDQFMS